MAAAAPRTALRSLPEYPLHSEEYPQVLSCSPASASIFWQSAILGRTSEASISALPESPPQKSMGRQLTEAESSHTFTLPPVTVMVTVQGSGCSSSARYLGLSSLSTMTSTLLSGGSSLTCTVRGRMSGVLPETVTVRSETASSPRLCSLNAVNSGMRQ